jgi:hypothetical protein
MNFIHSCQNFTIWHAVLFETWHVLHFCTDGFPHVSRVWRWRYDPYQRVALGGLSTPCVGSTKRRWLHHPTDVRGVRVRAFGCSPLKERLGDQRGGSEWEPIKILLEGDWNSDKMNSLGRTPKITRSALLPSVCQNHVATGVLLVLGTNTTSNLNTHAPTIVETTRKPTV